LLSDRRLAVDVDDAFHEGLAHLRRLDRQTFARFLTARLTLDSTWWSHQFEKVVME